MTDLVKGTTELSTKAAVAYAANLLRHYSFDLNQFDAETLLDHWLRTYPVNWVRLALVEALYQGRYKAVSVEQILAFWQRRGQPMYHFNHDFERLVCDKFPRNLAPELEAEPDTPPEDPVIALKRRSVLQLPSVKASSSLRSPVKMLLQNLAETSGEAEVETPAPELVDPPVPAYSYTLKSWQGRPLDPGVDAPPPGDAEATEPEEVEPETSEPGLPSDRAIPPAGFLPEQVCPEQSDASGGQSASQSGVEAVLPAAVEVPAGAAEVDVTTLTEPIFIADLAEARNGNSAGSRLSPGLRRLKAKLQPDPAPRSEVPPVD